MVITHFFSGPAKKGAAFHGWAGVVAEWNLKSAPEVTFGKWKRDPDCRGGSVTFEARPFQLCMFGANSKEMAPRDKFTHFAFAGLGANGALRLQKLPEDTDARGVFEAGGWLPPAVTDLIHRVHSIAALEFREQLDEALSIVKCSSDGFGMGMRPPAGEVATSEKIDFIESFALAAGKWPHLSPIMPAVRSFLEAYTLERDSRREKGAANRKDAFERAVSEVRALGGEITPIRIAAWMGGVKEMGESIPHKIKEKARRLKKDYAAFFANPKEKP